MESNPYTTPSANLFGSTSGTSTEGVPQEAITQLQGTKPWVRFIGVLMWLAVALMLLGGVAVALATMAGAASAFQGDGGAASLPMVMGMAAMYAIMALLYVYPTIKIWKYGTFIGKLVVSRSPEDLVAALDQQRAFWKFIGVLMIITFAIYIVALIGLAVVGVSGLGSLPMPEAVEANP